MKAGPHAFAHGQPDGKVEEDKVDGTGRIYDVLKV